MSLTEPKKKPRLLVIAGSNGSGKSTVTKGLPLIGLYVNADEIKRVSGCTDLEAAQEAEQLRELLLARGADFTFETVLSTDRNLSLLRRAKEAGYEICAVFVLTSDVEINVRRVQERAAAGGHDVPEDKIRSRYTKSLQNLSPLVRIADKTRVLDNSGAEPRLICEVEGNAVRIWDNDVWTKSAILRLLEKRD
ncbi:MAG: zeta toxin family protein [Oscillospiraceae bacterium]|nr:zeta toxin family protein [Oscillospiraceae bacterium]MBQ9721434.1 zeta toxin family protein [Oscillospiraceae bacterium]